jgi:hypothetical protein
MLFQAGIKTVMRGYLHAQQRHFRGRPVVIVLVAGAKFPSISPASSP